MADKTADRTAHKALMVPDPRYILGNTWSAQSTVAHTNEGPAPSAPSPQQDTDLVLEATGQIAAASTYEITTRRAGMPGPNGAGYTWKESADTDDRGWNPPNVLMGYESIDDLSGVSVATRYSHSVTLSDGTVVAAYAQERAVLHAVQVVRRSATAHTWSSAVTVDSFGAYSTGRDSHPTLCVLPDDRLLLFYWVEQSTGDMQVASWTSTDKGATWTQISSACLPSVVEYDASAVGGPTDEYSQIGRLRAAYKDGQVGLWASVRIAAEDLSTASEHYCRDTFIQWASTDMGASMQLVEVIDPAIEAGLTSAGGFHDVVVADGYFQVVFISCYLSDGAGAVGTTLTAPALRVARLGNAFQKLSLSSPEYLNSALVQAGDTTTYGANPTYEISDGDCAACVADSGEVYVFHRYTNGTQADFGLVLWSGPDNEPGDYRYLSTGSWTPDGGTWFSTNTATCHPRDFCVTWVGAGVCLLFNWDAPSAATDDSLSALFLGGYSTVTMPATNSPVPALDLEHRAGAHYTWIPIEEPDQMGWTLTGAGSATLTAEKLNCNGTSGAVTYTRTLTSTPAKGAIVWGRLEVVQALSVVHYVQIRLGDGTDDQGIKIEFDNSGTELKDEVSGGSIATDTTIDPNDGIEFMAALWTTYADLWVRAVTTPGEPDREWTYVGGTAALTTRGTPSTTKEVEFSTATGASSICNWVTVNVADSYSNAEVLCDGWTNPDDLMVRSYGAAPTHIDAGLFIAAKDGPTYPGEAQHIATRYQYGTANVFPRTQPSPRRPWWPATGDALAVRLNVDTANPPPWLSQVLAFAVQAAPGWEIAVSGYNGSAWASLGTLSTVENVGNTTRGGDSFSASATSGTYFHANELIGAWFYMVSGANWVLAPILANSEGRWDNTTNLRARVICDWARMTSSGTIPTGGTGYVLHPSAALVAHHNGTDYSAFKFAPTHAVAAVGTVPDDLATIGGLFPAWVFPFGLEYAWGRVYETTMNVEITEFGDWTRSARSRSGARRVVDFAWTDGIDTTAVMGSSPDPDYIKGTTDGASLGVASLAGTGWTMEGIARMVNGAEHLVGYLPSLEIESARSGTSTYQRRDALVIGRLEGGVRIETVQGEERATEVVRVASTTITEEV